MITCVCQELCARVATLHTLHRSNSRKSTTGLNRGLRGLPVVLATVLGSGLASTTLLAALPEVSNVRGNKTGAIQTLSWDSLGGTTGYNVYRGTIASLYQGSRGSCLVGSIQGTSYSFTDEPPVGTGFFFVVSGFDETGEGAVGSINPSPRCTPVRRFFSLTTNGDQGGGLSGTEPRLNPSTTTWGASYVSTGVYLHTGEFFASAVDLEIPGRGLDFAFQRTYRNQIHYDGPLGNGWELPLNARLAPSGSNVLYLDGTGRRDIFTQLPGPPFFASPTGLFATLTRNGNGSFTVESCCGISHNFHALDGSNRQGALESIVDHSGNTLTLNYDAQGLLTGVTDTVGRSITFLYNASGRMTSMTDYAGRTVTYTYDSNGDLIAVRSPLVTGTPNGNDFPSGKTTRYTYSSGSADPRMNHNLLAIFAPGEYPAGPPVLQNTYDTDPRSLSFDGVLSETVGGTNASGTAAGGSQTFSYQLDPFLTGMKTTLTDRNGNLREYLHDSTGHLVNRLDYTNRGIRPGAMIYETDYSYTEEGLLSSRLDPRGNGVTMLYDSANPRRQSQGNLLEQRRTANGIAGGGTDLVTRFTYEPVFNQRYTITDPRGFPSGTVPFDANGHLDLNNPAVSRFTTTTLFDYQESTGFQALQGIPVSERIPEGLGDLNGADDFNQGNPVVIVYPRIQTSGPNLGETAVGKRTYNAHGQLLTSTDPEGHVTAHAYDPGTGYEVFTTKDAGNLNLTTEFVHDNVGNVIQSFDPKHQDMLFTFNSLNEVVRALSRPVSGSIRYQTDTFYDANNNRVRVERQNLKEDGSAYAHNPLVEVWTMDILDNVRAIDQDKSINDNSVTGMVRTEYSYDPNQNRTAVKMPLAVNGSVPSNIITTLYDERDLAYRVITGDDDTDPSNVPPASASITTTNYDANGNLLETIDGIRNATHSFAPVTLFPGSAAGDVTREDRDGFDRTVKVTDGEGNERNTGYDLASNPVETTLSGPVDDVATTLSLLMRTDVTYDERNRIVQKDSRHFQTRTGVDVGDGHQITQHRYDRDGKLLEVTDDRGLKTTMQWDSAERRFKEIDQLGNETEYGYDANGNVITTIRRDKSSDLGSPTDTFVTSDAFDGVDRMVKRIDPGGDVNEYLYDSRNNVVKISDALRGGGQPSGPGNIIRKDFDGLDRLVRVDRVLTSNGRGDGTPASVITTRQSWDDDSRLATQTDDNNHTTSYAYDAVNRLTSTTYADLTTRTATFDVDNHEIHWTDQNGTVATMTYDGDDRLLSRSVLRGRNVIGSTSETFGYDGAGRMTHAANDDGIDPGVATCDLEYDSLSNRTKDAQGSASVDSTYDGAGNRTQVTYPGKFGGGRRGLSVLYDGLNRIQAISDSDGPIAAMHYKGPQRLERRTYGPDGSPASMLDIGYDPRPQPIDLNHRTGGLTTIAQFQYGYDRMEHRLFEKRIQDGNAGDVYRYDSVYRLTRDSKNVDLSPVAPGTELDPDLYASAPNRQEYAFDGAGNRVSSNSVSGGVPTITSYSETADGMLADAEVNQYTTTQVGALPVRTYTYDSNGNLTSDGNLRYGYDFMNRMVEVRDQTSNSLIAQYLYDAFGRRRAKIRPSGMVVFLFDGQEVVEERDLANNIARQYVWGRRVDELLQERTSTTSYFAHENAMGSISALSDASGAVNESYGYDPYGGVTVTIDGSTGNRYRYHGAYGDDESGLYYMRARYYSPDLGRFMSRDPIGAWGDAINVGNGYTYVGNDPTDFSDPSGRMQMMLASGGNNCDGACGPGCSWCEWLWFSTYLCTTSSFCQCHDTHCGAWRDFLTCDNGIDCFLENSMVVKSDAKSMRDLGVDVRRSIALVQVGGVSSGVAGGGRSVPEGMSIAMGSTSGLKANMPRQAAVRAIIGPRIGSCQQRASDVLPEGKSAEVCRVGLGNSGNIGCRGTDAR